MRKPRHRQIRDPAQYIGRTFNGITIINICQSAPGELEQSCTCRCHCGKEFTVPVWRIISNVQRSCGTCGGSEKIKRPLPIRKSLVGQRFGKLTVIEIAGRNTQNRITYRCICDCGRDTIVASNNLSSGNTKSCGKCNYARNSTGNGLRLYNTPVEAHLADSTYSDMKRRCYDPSSPEYRNYGARGITICDEWLAAPKNFVDWCMLHEWQPGLTIHRIDNNGPYAPWNCKLVPMSVQNNHKRNNRIITVNGITKTVAEWAREIGVNYRTLWAETDEQIVRTIRSRLTSSAS